MAKNRRIFGGYYKRYDGKSFFVVTVAKDCDTEEETIILFPITYSGKTEYMTISKSSFCETIEWKGKKIKKFARQTQIQAQEWLWDQAKNDGFDNVHRVRKKQEDFEDEFYRYTRNLRSAKSYEEYAKDLCKNYIRDNKKYELCKAYNRYIGISKEDFKMMITDHRFVKYCMDTTLSEFKAYFTQRYVEGISVRRYAEEHQMSRGSVEHIERKMIRKLAFALKERDATDGKIRIKASDDRNEK